MLAASQVCSAAVISSVLLWRIITPGQTEFSVLVGVFQLTTQQKKNPCLLWVCRGDEGYGVASAIVNFSVSLEKQGWRIAVVTANEGKFTQRCRDLNWFTVSLDVNEFPKGISGSLIKRLGFLRKTAKVNVEIIEAAKKVEFPRDFDIKVVQSFNMLLLKALSAIARNCNALAIWRMPTHIRPRAPINYARIYLQFKLWRYAVVAMGTSKFTTRSLGQGPAQLLTNPHGVSSERFTPSTSESISRHELGIPDDAVVFIIVAQLYENDAKGQLTFASALTRLDDSTEKLHLLLLGGPADGELAKKIKTVFAKSDAEVYFTGPVSNVEKYYPLANIAVSARLSPEPFGLSVVEAMLMCKPVLVHASGGPAEIIDDRVTGWHAPSPGVSAFATAISSCLSDRSSWEEMGNKARSVAEELYTSEAEVSRWLAQVKEQIDGRQV